MRRGTNDKYQPHIAILMTRCEWNENLICCLSLSFKFKWLIDDECADGGQTNPLVSASENLFGSCRWPISCISQLCQSHFSSVPIMFPKRETVKLSSLAAFDVVLICWIKTSSPLNNHVLAPPPLHSMYYWLLGDDTSLFGFLSQGQNLRFLFVPCDRRRCLIKQIDINFLIRQR